MDQTALFRLMIFAILLVIMAGWEVIAPFRDAKSQNRSLRWLTNFGLMICGAALSRFTVGAAMVFAASWSQSQQMGLLHFFLMPEPLAILVSVILLDCAVYWQHRLTHIVPLLWLFHRVHHTDTAFDVSTAVRFHPLEILASLIYKTAIVAIIGADPWAVVIYETLLSGFALFNHGNVHLPGRLDRALRKLIVTPDMHRVHHSSKMVETNSNYGNMLSVWDRIFSSYTVAPADDPQRMEIGLETFRDTQSQSLWASLWLPFRRKQDGQ